ncbi:MAG: hypothetical protein ABIH41_04640 [Nanoarchaeota archaeon]
MQKRGSYFFVLDVFLAGAIIVLTLVIILSSRSNAPQPQQTYTTAEDFLTSISTTQFRDVQNPWQRRLQEAGFVNRTEWNLDQVVASLDYYDFSTNGSQVWQPVADDTNMSFVFVQSLQEGLVPAQFGFSYALIDGADRRIIYNRSNDTLDSATTVLSARRITFFPIDSSSIYGPVITEVKVWN